MKVAKIYNSFDCQINTIEAYSWESLFAKLAREPWESGDVIRMHTENERESD